MVNRMLTVGTACLLAAAAEAGAPVPKDFEVVFGRHVYRGAYVVVTRDGLPTTPLHGADGKQAEAYFSVDVKNGAWTPSNGLMDTNQVQTSTLRAGEVMEIAGVSLKDAGRIDLRLVSADPHPVLRPTTGEGQEAASTNFKFFFPFTLRSALDAPAALAYIGRYLQVFRGVEEARGWAERAFPGSRTPAAPGASRGMVKATIKIGMTPFEVVDALGKPKSEVSSGTRSKWVYPDLSVIFENGRVKEVTF